LSSLILGRECIDRKKELDHISERKKTMAAKNKKQRVWERIRKGVKTRKTVTVTKQRVPRRKK